MIELGQLIHETYGLAIVVGTLVGLLVALIHFYFIA